MGDVRKPHFLVGFDPSFCAQALGIPFNFVKHIERTVPATAILVGPSGNTWYIDLIQVDDGLFLNDGWATFVSDHLLVHGDYLVFRYDGDLHFNVQIFDQGMCEKETSFSAESTQDLSKYDSHIVKKRERHLSALLHCINESVPKKTRSERANHGNVENPITVAVPVSVVHRNPSDLYDNSNRNVNHTLFLASEAESIANSFSSSFPTFRKVMKRFNISGSYTLNIPYQFATEHLPNCKLKINLCNLKGESWTVNSIPTTRVQTSHTFCGGWLSFVRDNSIGLGDYCIFELVCEYEMRVRILRVVKEDIDDARVTTSGIISRKKSKKINTMKTCSKSDAISESGDRTSFSSIYKQVSQAKGFVSMKSAPEEKIAAQSFVSNFPHFVKIMKKFNISGSYTLKIPCQFSMEHLPSCRTEIVLRNLDEKSWIVNSVPTTKVQSLHTFCGGWMAFVRDNDIQMGDICIFELIGECELRVHVCGIGNKGLNYQSERRSERPTP